MPDKPTTEELAKWLEAEASDNYRIGYRGRAKRFRAIAARLRDLEAENKRLREYEEQETLKAQKRYAAEEEEKRRTPMGERRW